MRPDLNSSYQNTKLPAISSVAKTLAYVTFVLLLGAIFGSLFAEMPIAVSLVLQSVIITALALVFIKYLLPSVLPTFKRLLPRRLNDSIEQVTDDDDTEEGDIDILEGIQRYSSTHASEIMTPRIDITDIDASMNFEEVMRVVIDSGHARIPVYEGNEDSICGILFSRDLMPYIGKVDKDFKWQKLLREPYFVPESRMIDDLLDDFRKRKQHLAIVVDEFGSTQGIVTLEDVLEEIVGDIYDEDDLVDTTYKRLNDDTFEFEGRTPLTNFFRITDLDENDYNDVTENVETLAGMLLSIKGDFPKKFEPLVYGRCHFLVLKIVGRRIVSVRVKVMPETEQP